MRDLAVRRTSANLGAAAAVRLLHGRPREAAPWLEEALDAAPGDARLWSDLAAARLLTADSSHSALDLVQALSAADRALRLDPNLAEARVNLALSLERLSLTGEARGTWCQAAAAAPTAAWRRELVGRCRTTAGAGEPSPAERWRHQRERLLAAADRGEAAAVREVVLAAPQESRELAMDDLLARWGEETLRGHAAAAQGALRAARAVGDALADGRGDQTVLDAVRAVDGTPAAALRRAARGCSDYAAGRRLYRAFELGHAASLLRQAIADLEPQASPLARWARLWLAGIEVQRGAHAAARRALLALVEDPGSARYPSLLGLGNWLLAMSYGRTGDFPRSLERYRAADRGLSQTREELNLVGVEALTAEILDYLGQGREAWDLRFRALSWLRHFPASVSLQNLLRDAARAEDAAGEPETALHFWTECLLAARRTGSPELITHTLVQRSQLEARLGQTAAALADLAAARAVSGRIGDAAMRERLAADLAVATADLAAGPASRQDRTAELSSAIRIYESRHLDLEIVPALLVRARLALGSGAAGSAGAADAAGAAGAADAALDEAEADLRRGVEIFEAHRSAVVDREQRLSFLDAAARLFDEMVLFQVARRHDPAAAFEYAERARTSLAGLPRPAGAAREGSSRDWLLASISRALSRRAVPAVVLEYMVLGEDLLIWRIDGHGFQLVTVHGAIAELRHETLLFLRGLRTGASAAALEPVAAHLFERLILPVEQAGGTLPASAELIVVPDRFLNGLPFGALWDRRDRRFLLEARPVALCPQASLLVRSPAARTGTRIDEPTALLVGGPRFDRERFPWLPDLPGALQEVSRIAAIYTRPVVQTETAPTRARFLRALGSAEVLHFAGHALPNDDDPAAAQLVLAASSEAGDPETVSGRDLLAQTLPRLRLVVLSACGSAVPGGSRTGSLFGLARPFLAAGAGAVVGTLWGIDDRIALSVLPSFHRLYLEGGSAAQALRAAILPLTRAPTGEPLSPSRWAAFSVIQKDESFNESTKRREP